MTDKLHCPFCGAELKGWREQHLGEFYACCNDECTVFGKFKGTFGMWQALIDGKKAQDALNRSKEKLDLIAFHSGEDCTIARQLRTIAKDALDEITSITKQEE